MKEVICLDDGPLLVLKPEITVALPLGHETRQVQSLFSTGTVATLGKVVSLSFMLHHATKHGDVTRSEVKAQLLVFYPH